MEYFNGVKECKLDIKFGIIFFYLIVSPKRSDRTIF